VRNRVAHSGVRGLTARAVRGWVTLTLVPMALVIAIAAPAAADPVSSAAAERWSFGVVGVAAVALGLGGVVIGLSRRRRGRAAAALLETRPIAPVVVEPARSEKVA
jgi:hypothetical protein